MFQNDTTVTVTGLISAFKATFSSAVTATKIIKRFITLSEVIVGNIHLCKSDDDMSNSIPFSQYECMEERVTRLQCK